MCLDVPFTAYAKVREFYSTLPKVANAPSDKERFTIQEIPSIMQSSPVLLQYVTRKEMEMRLVQVTILMMRAMRVMMMRYTCWRGYPAYARSY